MMGQPGYFMSIVQIVYSAGSDCILYTTQIVYMYVQCLLYINSLQFRALHLKYLKSRTLGAECLL